MFEATRPGLHTTHLVPTLLRGNADSTLSVTKPTSHPIIPADPHSLSHSNTANASDHPHTPFLQDYGEYILLSDASYLHSESTEGGCLPATPDNFYPSCVAVYETPIVRGCVERFAPSKNQ